MFTRSSKDYIGNPEEQGLHLLDIPTQIKSVSNGITVAFARAEQSQYQSA